MASILAFTFANGAAAQAPSPPSTPPPPSPLLSEWVGGHFDSMMRACLPGEGRIRFRNNIPGGGKDAPRIPRSVSDALGLGPARTYRIFGQANMSRLFGYVYTKADTERVSGFSVDTRRYLNVDYSKDAGQIVESGMGSLIYNQDCRGAIDVAANATGNVPLAPATLGAAANSALAGNFSARMSIASGWFRSPVSRQWHFETDEPERSQRLHFYSAMLLWDWYRRNPNAGTENFLLYAIEGVSLYRFQSNQSELDLTASVNASLSIPFLSASTEVSGQLARSSSLKRETFEFVMANRTDNQNPFGFEPMPTQEALRAAIAGNAMPKVDILDGDLIRPGSVKLFTVEIRSMPAAYCDQRYESQGTEAAQIRIRSVTWDFLAPVAPLCRFLVEFNPPASITGEGPYQLNFGLQARKADLPSSVAPFVIPVSVEFQKSDRPRLEVFAAAGTPAVQQLPGPPSVTRLTWTTNLRLWDSNEIVDPNQVDTSGLYMVDCPIDAARVGEFVIDRNLPTRSNTQNRPIELTVRGDFTALPQDWGTRVTRCRVGGQIRYTIDNRSVPRIVPEIFILVPTPAP